MHAWLHGPPERLGRRGAVLLILGVIWCLIGLLIPFADPSGGYEQTGLLHLLLPLHVRTALWVGIGAAAVVTAFGTARSWDKAGFMLLLAMPVERCVSYLWALVTWALSGGNYGYPEAALGGLVWLAIVALIFTIAGWAEPPKVRRLDDGR